MTTVDNSALLDRLMSANEEIKETVHIPRLDMDIVLKALSTAEVRQLTLQATYPDGKGGKKVNETELNEAMMTESIVGPEELKDKKLMKHLGAKNVGEVLEHILLLGEMQKVQEAFASINGVTDDAIQEAKN